MKKEPTGSGTNLTRRGFIGGGATAAFAIMKPATALGSSANSRIQVGIVGVGSRGKMIARMVRSHGGYEITAMADYFPDVVDVTGEEFEVKKNHRFSGLKGYERLLDTKPEAVFLETPPYCFPEHARTSVDAGCHVYIAKPLGCDVPGCLTVSNAGKKATANKRVFLVDFQTRTDPFFIEGIRRVRQGDFGAIGLVSSVYC
ncbi:MAG: Gfo/Idh/MocA family oxidoreductase, partial [bacterium]|nr:Gfo/Idh/MocA family oxidoreductase [bacterium]